jgi:metallo-beta-lactamase class B
MHTKFDRIKSSDANPFIDPQGYRAYIAEKEQAFRATLTEQRRPSS